MANVAVKAFNTLVAKFPVTVKLEAVVDAIVDDPDTVKFVPRIVCKAPIPATKFVSVVEPRVEEPTVKKFAATSVPVLVDEPVFNDNTFPF